MTRTPRDEKGLHRSLSTVAAFGLLFPLVSLVSCDTLRDTVGDITATPPPVKQESDAYRKEPEIRVRVEKGARDKAISGPQRFTVRAIAGSRAPISAKSAVVNGPLKISSSDRGVTVADGSGTKHDYGFGVDVEVLVSDGTLDSAGAMQGESIFLDGKAYPGFVTFRPHWNDDPATFDVCVSMPVESYLPGVLSKELYRDWPRQAFEAQAVAARTYALQERQRARSEGKPSDVEDTTADQVFGGTSNLTVAIEATRATRGLVLVEDGKLIRAYFSSQCGGRPASAGEAWPARKGTDFNKAQSLQAVKRQAYCQRSPLNRWTVTRTSDDLTKRLRAWGRGKNNDLANLTRLRAVDVQERNDAGRPNRYAIRDDNDRSYIVAAEEFREACNWPVQGLPPITKENRLNSGDVEVTVWASEVRFSGRGYGHGVGMCQWCAKGMAENGMDWRSMIEQFYPTAQVKKLY